jgi:hypothetical protein
MRSEGQINDILKKRLKYILYMYNTKKSNLIKQNAVRPYLPFFKIMREQFLTNIQTVRFR